MKKGNNTGRSQNKAKKSARNSDTRIQSISTAAL